jgi:hypothetical protein
MTRRVPVGHGAQIAIEENVGTGAVHAMLQAQTILKAQLRRHPDRRPALTDQQRRNRNVQPIQEAGV